MILLVRKPDYLGDTLWEFRHGRQTIEAHMLDEHWMECFRDGREVITPGSALECIVGYQYGYDEKGDLVTEKHDVIEVIHVIKRGRTHILSLDS